VAFSKQHGGFNVFFPPYFFNFHFANIFGDDVLLEIPKKKHPDGGPKKPGKRHGPKTGDIVANWPEEQWPRLMRCRLRFGING
jgi:hypothetical protein